MFVQAEKPTKAMIAYEIALDWRELFDLAVRENTPEDKLVEMGLRIAGQIGLIFWIHLGVHLILADDLSSKKRYAEAATVFLDYAEDARQAVIAYVEVNFFADARRIVSPLFRVSVAEHITDFFRPPRSLCTQCLNLWKRSSTLAHLKPNRSWRKIWER